MIKGLSDVIGEITLPLALDEPNATADDQKTPDEWGAEIGAAIVSAKDPRKMWGNIARIAIRAMLSINRKEGA